MKNPNEYYYLLCKQSRGMFSFERIIEFQADGIECIDCLNDGGSELYDKKTNMGRALVNETTVFPNLKDKTPKSTREGIEGHHAVYRSATQFLKETAKVMIYDHFNMGRYFFIIPRDNLQIVLPQ